MIYFIHHFSKRGVAQSGRVLVLGTRCRKFKSCLPDQYQKAEVYTFAFFCKSPPDSLGVSEAYSYISIKFLSIIIYTVRKNCIKASGRKLGRSFGCKNKKHILDGKESKILELRSKGISQAQIAKILNVSSSHII